MCAPGVTGLSIDFESTVKKPAVPICVSSFEKQLKEVALTHGMPGIRIQYIRGPIWAKTREQLRRDVVFGNNPLTGKPVMQEIVDKLTRPLTAEERRTGQLPRDKGPGSPVYCGTLNGNGLLRVRVTGAGEQTTLARVISLVREARANKAPVERLADRYARYFLPALLVVSGAVYLYSRDWLGRSPC